MTTELQQEALSRARNGASFSNYAPIIRGFLEKGIAENEIKPRENVFTFHAWRALGRTVKRGEHGVSILSFVPVEEKERKTDQETGDCKTRTRTRPRAATVFHVSQTTELVGGAV